MDDERDKLEKRVPEFKEFHINKENFDSVIQGIPFSKDIKIIFDDQDSYIRFNEFLNNMECTERLRSLVVSEIYMKCYHNGYCVTFKDCMINSKIEIPNPNFGKQDPFKGSTKIFAGIEGCEAGDVDITPLVYAAIREMEENPGKKVQVKITGWARQLHFNKDLLTTPKPKLFCDPL